MPAKCEKLLPFAHRFEEEGYSRLCQDLKNRSGNYTVTSPVKIKGRDIDGLIIAPSCIFTLEYHYLYSVAGMSLLLAIVAASCWPVPLSGSVFLDWDISETDPGLPLYSTPIGGDDLAPQEATNTPTTNSIETPFAESPSEEEETKVPTATTSTESTPEVSNEKIIQIMGNSNVRAEPDGEAEVIGYALDDEVYTVLESSPQNNWYKIQLESGVADWIGSSWIIVQSSE